MMGAAKICLFFLIMFSQSIKAQIFEEIEPVNFGTVAIVDNRQPLNLIIDSAGNYIISEGMYALVRGEPGIFRASGLAPNTRFFISLTPIQSRTVTETYSPEQFTVVSYNHQPSITTNGLGVAEFEVGGVFQTSGSGTTNFIDKKYTARFRVSIDF